MKKLIALLVTLAFLFASTSALAKGGASTTSSPIAARSGDTLYGPRNGGEWL